MSTKKRNTNTKSSGGSGTKKIAKSASTAKPKLKINAGALAKSERSPSPGTLMRAHGHKLVQMWVSKQLQSAILDRARAKGVRISDVLRETVGKEAEKWSGAAVGSLQTLRFVGGGVSAGSVGAKAGAPAGKNGAKSVKPAAKSAPAAKSVAKPSAKSARKASPRSSIARGGTKSAADVVAVAGSGDAAAETVAE